MPAITTKPIDNPADSHLPGTLARDAMYVDGVINFVDVVTFKSDGTPVDVDILAEIVGSHDRPIVMLGAGDAKIVAMTVDMFMNMERAAGAGQARRG